MSWRARIHELLEDDEGLAHGAAAVRVGIAALIGLSVAATMLDSVPSLGARWRGPLTLVETLVVLAFTVEYALRLWVCVEDRAERYAHPLWGRLRYARTPLAVVDLLAVLPWWLGLLTPVSPVLLRSLRLIRLLKIARISPALATLQVVVYNERRALLAVAVLGGVTLLLASALIYAAEREAQPDLFGSIPAALWWAVATLTTVGYGDVVPVTPAGRLVGGLTALAAIAMLALPTAILGAGFLQEMHKRDFASVAAMVARVPVFRHLAPAQLAEVAGLLQPRQLPPRYTVLRRGEHAGSMWFIDAGEVSVRTPQRRLTLGPGDYFGELALLEPGPRHTTIVTLTGCRLLELRAGDFQRLIAGDPTLRERMLEEMRARYAVELAGSS